LVLLAGNKKKIMSLRRNIGNVIAMNNQTDADIVLSAVGQPHVTDLPTVPLTVPAAYTTIDPVAATNSTSVAAIAPAVDNSALLYLGLGAGALFLLTRKKKRVGAADGEKKKSSMLPLLLVGGAAVAYYFYTQSQNSASAVATVTTTDPTTGAVVTTPVVQTGITVAPSVTLPDAATMHNQLYAYSVPWRYAVDRMSPTELAAMYTYVYGYLQKGLRLYAYPGIYQDGWYDVNLYNQLKALNTKWSLGILN
jgi:hypothetical protein